jgi:secreted trypsin-like serine protease
MISSLVLMPRPLPILLCLLILLSPTGARSIIDGTDAASGEFPWMAGIVRRDVAAPGLVGGGTLVGDQWVLTAAHSVYDLTATNLEVWLGVTALDDTVSRQSRRVLAVYVHPDFATDNGTSVNDLAMLLLDRPITTITPLGLVTNPADLATGDAVRLAGWGVSTVGATEPTNELQRADADILSNASAAMTFGSVIELVHLAAKDPAETACPCVGDSGGPLVKNLSGTDYLAGLVSFGSLDCDPTLPTIYTRIPSFAPWIGESLALTAAPSSISIEGKGRVIASGAKAKGVNGSDFGELRGPRARRTGAFSVANVGAGLLTVRSATVSGRGFSLRTAPATIVAAGESGKLKVSFVAPARGKRHQARIQLFTNDPETPVFLLRVGATVR